MAFSLSSFYSKGGPDQVDIADGGTDAANAAAARTNLGLTVYDSTTHNGLSHTAGPLNLLDETAHDALDHSSLTGIKVVNYVVAQTFSNVSTTSTIPFDATIPLSTEGAQALQIASYVPQSGANRIILRAVGAMNATGGGALALALFDGTTCRAVNNQARDSGGFTYTVPVFWEGSAINTVARTYSLRFGASTAGTCYLNHNGGGNNYGGLMNTVLELWELLP